ncbi:MAG: hypothetical protein CM15mP62_02880 [Rhodospirillaceae bacterium]|nr:MAG: hypothetical protein CM15mP62_02880 [Rhodospirillaceae bacterium]
MPYRKNPTKGDSITVSGALNFDFFFKGLTTLLKKKNLIAYGLQAFPGMGEELTRVQTPTVRDFIKYSQRGRPRDPIVGGPKEVADKLEEWFVERACDGFVFAASYTPGSYEDIVDHVVPELQKRGLYHKDYSGSTLRENVGVPVPPVRNWNKLD